MQIFNNLLRRQIGSRWPTVEYLTSKPEIIFAALAGYENEDVALNTGMILKEMLKHEPLAKILLHSDQCVTSPIDCNRYQLLPRTDIRLLQVLYLPPLHRNHDLRHFMRCLRKSQRNLDTTQANGCRVLGPQLRPSQSLLLPCPFLARMVSLTILHSSSFPR